MPRLRHLLAHGSAGLAALGLVIAAPAAVGAAAIPAGTTIYVSPHGDNSDSGTSPGQAVRTVQRAQQIVRSLDGDMTGDITVELASGTYRLSQPLTLGAQDSGTNGYNVVWTAAPGAHPVLSGAERVTGWHLSDPAEDIWSAPAPAGLQTLQLYVNGVRADMASGPLPVTLTPTSTGYTASATAMDSWINPGQIQFVYTGGEGYWSLSTGGSGDWTEPSCPVASISGTTITMAEPCWDNSNGRADNLVGPSSLGNGKIPAYAENAYELLAEPGQWYLDTAGHTLYYIPRKGQDMARADVEAPVLQTLVSGWGTQSAPVHNIVFSGIQFSYATWLQPSSPEGFSEIQANYTITGTDGGTTQGLCTLVTNGTCPYGDWTQEPGNVDFGYDQDIQFLGDEFTHLGAAGLRLGDGSQQDTVQGDIFTDISGNGLELGGVDDPEPTAAAQDTTGNQILDNHFYALPVQYHGGVAIDVGYAEQSLIAHNQIDDTAYTAISIGWGGWPDKISHPATPNYSNDNTIADNLIDDPMQMLSDGGAIYTQGITGSSLANGEDVTGNVILGALDHGHAIYTDNGATFVTINGNVEFGNENDWGSDHTDYTAGATGDDPLLVENNYWQQGNGNSSSDNVTVENNHVIASLKDVPASVLSNAGLQPAYRHLATETTADPSVPEAPDQVAAFAAAGKGYVGWNPTIADNGAPVTSYRVTAEPGGASATISAAAYARLGYTVVPGLTDGTHYTFTVQAVNRAGASAPSLPSAAVTVSASAGGVPSAPSISVESGDGAVSLHITAPSAAGGTPVTGYTISGPGVRTTQVTGHHVLWGATGSNSIFTTGGGLKAGQPYEFSVTADNVAGAGPAAVTPPVILGTSPACSGAQLSVSPADALVTGGQTVQVTTTLTNGCTTPLQGVSLYLLAPSGYTVAQSSPASLGDVAVGASVSQTWSVTVPADVTSGTAQLYQAAAFSVPGSSGSATLEDATVTSVLSVPFSSFAAAFDNAGISNDTDTGAANIDGDGSSFSAQALASVGVTPGESLTYDGIGFTWPDVAAGVPDNVVGSGQTIDLSGSGTTLGLLDTSVYGDSSGTGTITYTNGTTQTFSLDVPNWYDTAPAGSNAVIIAPYRNRPGNTQDHHVVNVFEQSIPLQAGLTVESVTLPDISASVVDGSPSLHVFAIAIGG
jgi:hypothetical protein